ncbi:MAG: flagellar export protein FliJ [Burkholderiales bacterium]
MSGLQVALELAQDRRDASAQVLAQARQGWLAAQVQLEQLESYAQESGARWSTRSGSCTPDLMRHHYQFMERLTHAIGLQTGMVAEQQRKVVREASVLREAEGRLESLRQLCFARERELKQALDRREQKQTDEYAALRHRRQILGQTRAAPL